MIQLPPATSLSGIERFGLDLLVDLSRLLPVDPETGSAPVRLEIAERDPEALDLRRCLARDWYLQRSQEKVTIPRAVLALVGETAAGAAEQRSEARDKHGRVPPSENQVAAANLEKQPVISLAAKALREAVHAVGAGGPFRLIAPWPEGRRWAAAMTHDLDLVTLWPAAVLARVVELARKGEPGLAARAAIHAIASVGQNPVWKGVQAILNPEADFSARSTWFIICETPTISSMLAGDVTYHPGSPAARRILRDLKARGCEIALHGSFATADQRGVFGRQKERLGALSAATPVGIRQHFLRMRPAETPEWMREAGFLYDSTFGFSDRNGFRLGVADVLPLWNVAANRAVGVEEAPFCWMDRALSKYRGIESPAAWVDEGLALAAECRAVEGLWVGVWHPNVHPSLGFPGATAAFERLIGDIAALHPFMGSLSTIVRWRSARRRIRGEGVGADGAVGSAVESPGGFTFHLEDMKGRVLETVRSRPS